MLTRIFTVAISMVFVFMLPACEDKAVNLNKRPTSAEFIDNHQIKNIQVFKSDAGKGIVRIQASGVKSEKVQYRFGDKTIQLEDTGQGLDIKKNDGVFSGEAPASLMKVEQEIITLLREAAESKPQPIFKGRHVIGRTDPSMAKKLLAQIESTTKRPTINGEKDIPFIEMWIVDHLLKEISILDVRIPDWIFVTSVAASSIDMERSLAIRDLGVVEDPNRTFDVCAATGTPNGVWTFGYLMTQMANTAETGITPEAFTRRWLRRWETDQVVNDFLISKRPNISKIIDPWPKLSNGDLDLTQAPFRLLAIINRVDLASNLTYGTGSAGEARFVFGAIDRTGGGCGTMQFTVIFEYGIKKSGCFGLKSWARKWKDLDQNAIGTSAYNAALETITRSFTDAGSDPSQLPNQSALSQLRTNEVALNFPWELREFRLQPFDASAGHLEMVTTKQTPDILFHPTPAITIRDYVNANEADILNDAHTIPLEFPAGLAFLSGNTEYQSSHHWSANGIGNNDARHHFSLNTCNGCHARETVTSFKHVEPRNAGAIAGLSKFMIGDPAQSDGFHHVNDPVTSGTVRLFNDLARRQQAMANILNRSCFLFPVSIPFMPMVH